MPPAADEYGMPLQTAGSDEYGMPIPQGAPSVPSPSPVADLQPILQDGVNQLPPAVRGYNELFFANDPVGSAAYLKSKGFAPAVDAHGQPTSVPSGEVFGHGLENGVREVGGRLIDAANDVPRMAAMGLGALGGGALGGLAGIETGPGALVTGALGAGAGDAAASAGLSSVGAHFAGIDQNSPGAAAVGGAGEGVVGEVAGQALGKAVNLLRDRIDIPQGIAVLKDLFGLSNKVLGKDAVKATFPGPVAFPQADTEIGKVLTDPEVLNLMKSAQATPGNSLVQLGKDTESAVSRTGQSLYGYTDNAGNKVAPGVIEKIDTLPKSPLPFADFHTATNQFVDEVTQQLRVANVDGDLINRSGAIRHELESQVLTLKNSLTKEASDQAAAAANKLTLLNEGGIDATSRKAMPGLKELKAQLAPLQAALDKNQTLTKAETSLYQNLRSQIDPMEDAVKDATQSLLAANAKTENPMVSFQTLNDFKSAVGQLGAWNRTELKPDLGQAYRQFAGKLSEFTKAHALAVDGPLGAEYANSSSRYDTLKTFSDMIQETVGAATKQPGPVTGLAVSPKDVLNSTVGGVKQVLTQNPLTSVGQAASVVKDAMVQDPMNSVRLNLRFSQAVRKLPDLLDPNAQFRGNAFTNAAAQVAASPATKMVLSATLGRAFSPLLQSVVGTAQAQEPDLSPLQNGILVSSLVESGAAPGNAHQAGVDLNSVDPQALMLAQQSTQQALQPLQDAIKFGSDDEIGAAYSQVVKQYPELFPAPKTGIRGEVVDPKGRIKLYDPMDRARYSSQVQLDSGMGWDEKARVVSELNSTFTVINPKKFNN